MTKEKVPFLRVFVISILIILMNFFIIVIKYTDIPTKGLTGFSIKDNLAEVYSTMPVSSKIFILGQFILLILVLGYLSIKKRNLEKEEKKINPSEIHKEKSETDLDVVYKILLKKNKLTISSISNAFKIEKETAYEWAKILEAGELATIDYPGFGEPILKIKQNSEENKEKNYESIKENEKNYKRTNEKIILKKQNNKIEEKNKPKKKEENKRKKPKKIKENRKLKKERKKLKKIEKIKKKNHKKLMKTEKEKRKNARKIERKQHKKIKKHKNIGKSIKKALSPLQILNLNR